MHADDPDRRDEGSASPSSRPTSGWTIAAAGKALRTGEVSAAQLTEECLAQIAVTERRLRAFVTVTSDAARAAAARADAELRAGQDRGPLHGIPLALKDLIATRGVRTAAGSAVLADHVPESDAAVVTLLGQAGAIMLGKTNTHEFAWGVFTPPTRNPWNTAHIPGGSSGGSAAAIAAQSALGALGTDTGGSIRIPSACCGITGLKPTLGLVPTDGIIPLSTTLDHAGPIARTTEDCALLLDALTSEAGSRYAAQIALPIADLRLGILAGPWEASVDPEVLAIVRAAITVLGDDLPVVQPPAIDHQELLAAYRGIQGPEAAAWHMEQGYYPAHADDYTPVTRERLERAGQIPAVRYVAALRQRARYGAAWDEALRRANVDLLLAPTIAVSPPRADQLDDPAVAAAYADGLLRLTFPFNMTGWPALSVPAGFTAAGLPVGLQIIARSGQDAEALRVGHAFQQRTDWHLRQPFIS